ncbi:unnamed protein product [Owenia fusiformis]|uniref:Uncharacterized protein n=1 Tax=Owenia fusiformis TaxID=6347 RepID=A0A8J1XYA7_OWEFU|nr:unnamed protein product [Owenia fusiformis]
MSSLYVNETIPEKGISFIESERTRQNSAFLTPYVFYEAFLFVIGAIGNTLIIGTFVVVKSMRTLPNAFVLSLAIADLMVTSVLQPLMMVGALMGERFVVETQGLCTFFAYICIQSCLSSAWNIMLISLNRFICICKNSWYSKIYSKKSVALMIAIAWFYGFVGNFLLWVGWTDIAFLRKEFTCMWDSHKNFSYVIFVSVVTVLIPVGLTAVAYFMIFLKVRESKKKIQAFSKKTEKKQGTRNDIRLARMLFIMFTVYCILCAPYALILTFDINDKAPYQLYAIFIHMFHTNSAVNFIIYGLTNKSYTKGYSLFSKYLLIKMTCGAYKPRQNVEDDIDKSNMTQTVTMAT